MNSALFSEDTPAGPSQAPPGSPSDDGLEDIQPGLPLAGPGGGLGGRLKAAPEDFMVREIRRPEEGEGGEHWHVRLEKKGWDTLEAARYLARVFSCKEREVGYAGLKDKWAVTEQTFSIHQPGSGALPAALEQPPEGVRILSVARYPRKIRIGSLVGNAFTIRLREVRSERRAAAEEALAWLARHGFPNYFGPQRFGRRGENFEQGLQVLARGRKGNNRRQEGILISAVRSELFNRLLALRIRQGRFTHLLPGDVAQLDGRSGSFLVEDFPREEARFFAGEIHPSGPLFGRNLLSPTGEAGAMEQEAAASGGEAYQLLQAFGVDAGRRALRAFPGALQLHWEGADLVLHFTLNKGTYATSLLREIMD